MCTTLMFKTRSGTTVAHNLDSHFLTSGLFFTNQPGLSKTAMIFPPDTPAAWTSKYGSITYNHVRS